MKYEFHVGDYVEMKEGSAGYISKMQPLSNGHTCLYVHFTDNKIYPYDVVDSQLEFRFNRIGQYNFTQPEPKSIERLPVDLVARFEVPDGRYITTKTWDKDGKFVEASYSRELIDKINELIDVVNELQEDYNTHLEAHKQNER